MDKAVNGKPKCFKLLFRTKECTQSNYLNKELFTGNAYILHLLKTDDVKYSNCAALCCQPLPNKR